MFAVLSPQFLRGFFLKGVVLFCCCFLLGSCQKTDSSPKHFRLTLDRPANPNHIPLYVGHALGFFVDEGIALEIKKPTTDFPLAQLEEGTSDFVLASVPRVFRAIARRNNIVIVGKLIEKPLKGFLILQSSGMKEPEDFNGRILGYDGTFSILPSAEVMLNKNNIQVGCRLNRGEETISELVDKKIDVVYGALSNLEPIYLHSMGHKVRFFLGPDLGMPQYDEVVVAAHASMKRSKKMVRHFKRALQRSINFCVNNPEVAFKMYANIQQSKNNKTMMWEEISWDETRPLFAKSQKFSASAVKAIADWQYENGLIGTPIDSSFYFMPAPSK